MNNLIFTLDSFKTNPRKIFFTSDLHFGHRNIISFAKRPFSNTKEMDKALIDNWNNVVSNNDKVFILGDMFWFNGRHDAKKICSQLKGDIYLIPGNHDNINTFELCDNIVILNDIVKIEWITGSYGNEYIKYITVLSHYPLMCYNSSEKDNCYQFFGHIHSKDKLIEFGRELPIFKGHQMDVGCDRWDYKPVELETLIEATKNYGSDKLN